MADELIVDIEKRFASGTIVSAALRTTMHRGRVVVLFGPSGAGKTTIVRSIAGLERPDRGHIRFGTHIWSDARTRVFVEPQARRVGYVGQEAALFPHLTVERNVEYGIRERRQDGRRIREGAHEILALLGASDLTKRYPRELSGGQAQRVALARAMAPHPRLLLLDEPFGALDAPTRMQLRGEMRALIHRLETSVLLVTHDRTEAIALGDEMAVLAGGRIRQVGPVLDVFRRPADLVVAQSVGVESVVPARIQRIEGGLVLLQVGEAILRAVDAGVDPNRTEVFACIRAEEVILQRGAAAAGSARNHLAGRIVNIDPEGPLDRVTIDCGFPLVALITRNAREELTLGEGTPVVAMVKATSVHVI